MSFDDEISRLSRARRADPEHPHVGRREIRAKIRAGIPVYLFASFDGTLVTEPQYDGQYPIGELLEYRTDDDGVDFSWSEDRGGPVVFRLDLDR